MSRSAETPTAVDLLDDYATARIEYRLARLRRALRLRREEVEDWRQEMVYELLKAAGRYDPRRCRKSTFVNRVLDVFICRALRRRRQRSRHRVFHPRPLEAVRETLDPFRRPDGSGLTDEQRIDLQTDLETVLGRMPAELRLICLCLMELSGRQTARLLGVAPSTVSRCLRRARGYFVAAGLE